MTDTLHRLVYYSRSNHIGSADAMERSIHQILESARRNNARLGITGALLFNAGCFGQVLEGPQTAVEQTFERIQRDPRHREVSVLDFGPIQRRAFDGWSMGYVGTEICLIGHHGVLADISGVNPSRMSADALFATLRRLVLEEEEA